MKYKKYLKRTLSVIFGILLGILCSRLIHLLYSGN